MNEFELIALLTSDSPREGRDLLVGVGDDCAVVSGPEGRDWLVTQDMLCEGVHFDLALTDPVSLGRKALSVNLSDIAAMGGAPRFWLCSISLPHARAGLAEEIYMGMKSVAARHGALLIGGDTSAGKGGLVISVTAIGEAPHGSALLRSRARPGDAVYVTGELGGSALGLEALRRKRGGPLFASFIKRHLDPEPRVEAGRRLALCGMVGAMIDISDGFMADMGHVASASGTGLRIDTEALPVAAGFAEAAAELGLDPLRLSLAGGEDYELAFTVSPDSAGEFEARVLPALGVPARRAGGMVADASFFKAFSRDGGEVALESKGYDHFAGETG